LAGGEAGAQCLPLLRPRQPYDKLQPMYRGPTAEGTDLARRAAARLRHERADDLTP
jgi:pyruvate dehydrogenase (quinone)